MKDIYTKPPHWCKDAVPSDRGWRHPVTGELLVAVKGGVQLAKQLTEVEPVVAVIKELKAKQVIDEKVTEDKIIDETVDSKPVSLKEEAPKKKTKKEK